MLFFGCTGGVGGLAHAFKALAPTGPSPYLPVGYLLTSGTMGGLVQWRWAVQACTIQGYLRLHGVGGLAPRLRDP